MDRLCRESKRFSLLRENIRNNNSKALYFVSVTDSFSCILRGNVFELYVLKFASGLNMFKNLSKRHVSMYRNYFLTLETEIIQIHLVVGLLISIQVGENPFLCA